MIYAPSLDERMWKFDDVLHLFFSVCVLNTGLYSYFRGFYNTDAITDALTGESIPVRLFLSPYELTPTYRNINNKFSVKYYLNLVLVDEEDRRYFKQQEITVYRLLPTPWMSVHLRGARKFYHDKKENRSSILASSLLLWRTKDSDLSWRGISLFSRWWYPSWFWPVKHIWWQKPFHVWDTWNCNISVVLIWLLHFKAALDSVMPLVFYSVNWHLFFFSFFYPHRMCCDIFVSRFSLLHVSLYMEVILCSEFEKKSVIFLAFR